ncbi:MAG: CoA transferase, partial [Actinomycetota bacterium]|nr:CoA transferase [Actinomycetota bacterium]
WGERGPWVDRPATDGMVAAATGIAWNQVSYTVGPVDVVLPLPSYGAGLLGALAIAAGLYARETQGAAPTYEVSLVAGAGAMQCGDFWIPELPHERDGSAPLGSNGRMPVYRPFEAADGQWFFLACGTPAFYERMVEAVGRPDLLDNPKLPSPPWGLLDLEALAYITPIVEEIFHSKTRAEWIEILRAHDVPCQPIVSRDDFRTGELAEANRLLLDIEHPELGTVSMTAPPLVLSAAPGRVTTPAPSVGQHTTEVLAEVHTPGTGSGQGGPPLQGIKAVDLSSFIAGPVITRHLAMLGAEVVKVESPVGDAFRVMAYAFASWNQGKRSIVLNLRTEEGQRQLHQIAAQSDVVVENFRPGVVDRLACDEVTLRSIRDDLVLVKSPGYGFSDEMARQPAFDPLLQALGGIMDAQGGDADPVFLTAPVHDVATPIIAAFGAVSALYQRASTGEPQTVWTSLAHTTTAVQAAELVTYEGSPRPRRGGFDHKGDPGAVFEETDAGWVWREGSEELPVEPDGFVWAEVAVANDLVGEQVHPEIGEIRLAGQYIVGAGPAPFRSPLLGEHQTEVAADYGLTVA